ncbi:hypothetical protein [Bacteroides acidifaciens]|uniref:hypothetical protein n=1 Tax=Bacteroides acidifaciens TaxID=85831 RepID=UPI00248B5F9F|nr:hypothetical protein [Bacteroides acidifaciens]
MKASEIEDCGNCPLLKEEICPGGMTSSPSGMPIEPPCCSFDDNTDLDKWIEDYYDSQRRYEKYLDRKWEAEQEKKRKAEKAKKRRNYLKWYCFNEKLEVKRARKRISAHQAAVSLAESMAFAFNTTNEIFGYSERVSVNTNADEELKKLQNALSDAESRLKEKQKEGRKTKRYLEIV